MALALLFVAACDSQPKETPPRTLEDLLGETGGTYKGPPTKTDLTPEAMVSLADDLVARGDLRTALQFYLRADELMPNNQAVSTGMGRIFLSMNVFDRAILLFRKARSLAPKSEETAFDLALTHIMADQPGAALKVINGQIAVAGPKLGMQNLSALSYDLMGDHRAAQAAYAAALKLAPGDPEVMSNLALSFALDGSFDTAEALLRTGQGTPQAIPLANHNLALVLALKGDVAGATYLVRNELSELDLKVNALFYERLGSMTDRQRTRAVFLGTLPPLPAKEPVKTAKVETPAPAPVTKEPATGKPLETTPATRPPTPIREKPTPPPVKKPEPVPVKTPEPERVKEPEPVKETEPEPVKEPEPAPVAKKDPEPEPAVEKEPEPKPVKEPEPKTKPVPAIKKEPEPVPVKDPEPEPAAKKEPEPEPVPVKTPEPEPAPVKEPEPAPVVKKDPDPEPAVGKEPKPEPVKEPEPETAPVKEPEPAPVVKKDPEPEPAVEKEPKPEPVKEPEPETAPVKEPEPEAPRVIVDSPTLYWVQLGSYKALSRAKAGWTTLANRHPDILEEAEPSIQRFDALERGIFWRLMVNPNAERPEALSACEGFLMGDLDCLVIKTGGDIRPLEGWSDPE